MKYEQKIRTKTEQKEESVNVLWRELDETEQEQTRGGVDRFDPLGLVADGDQSKTGLCISCLEIGVLN